MRLRNLNLFGPPEFLCLEKLKNLRIPLLKSQQISHSILILLGEKAALDVRILKRIHVSNDDIWVEANFIAKRSIMGR